MVKLLLSVFSAASLQTDLTSCHQHVPDGSKKQGSFTCFSSKTDFLGIWLKQEYQVTTRIMELGRLRELA
jgi:hypothetical protein